VIVTDGFTLVVKNRTKLEDAMAETKPRKRGIFDWYFKTNLLERILVGLVLGALVGNSAGILPQFRKALR